MTETELRDALEGLFAYDTGAVDSGIHDEGLRARCQEAISEMRLGAEAAPRLWLSRLVRDLWLSEEALQQGYGVEDAVEFLRWLDERMGVAA